MLFSRLAVATVSLSRSFRDALRIARELGFHGVEIDGRSGLPPDAISQSGVRQIRKWLDDHGLEVAAVSFPTRRGYGDPEALEPRVAATKSAMRLAHDLGARLVTNHIGSIPPEAEDPRWKLLIDVLTDIGVWSDRVGCVLAAEAGRSAPEDLRRVIAALPAGALACDVVIGSLVVHGHDPVAAIETLGAGVAFMHATDAVSGPIPGRGRAVVLGTGHVDFPAVLAALEQQGYRGWLGLEPVDGVAASRELTDAIGYLRAI